MIRLFIILTLLLVTSCSSGGGDEDVFNSRLSLVTQWNELALDAVRKGKVRPTVVARQLFILSLAMYDAWSLYNTVATPTTISADLRRPESEHTTDNKRIAVSIAAYYVLMHHFPQYAEDTGNFDKMLEKLSLTTSQIDDSYTTPESIGMHAAISILDSRIDDGANETGNYQDTTSNLFPALYAAVNEPGSGSDKSVGGAAFDPNRWQPLQVPNGNARDADGVPVVDPTNPDTFSVQTFLTPHFGAVRPFATDPRSVLPQRPPQKNSSASYTDARGVVSTNDEAWNRQFDEVLSISAGLTDREKVIAEFWADGPRSESPPGHWNQLAHSISERDKHGIDQDIKMFFALNAAVFDAGVAVWYTKRVYDFIRPASAIRHKYFGQKVMAWGGPNLGTQEINGEDWRPYQDVTFVTPPFAEYISGHSTFSMASATVLRDFTGSDQFYDGVSESSQDVNSDGIPDMVGEYIEYTNGNAFEQGPSEDIVLRWLTFTQAAEEAGVSRLYGGIHIQDGNLFGLSVGRKIGSAAYSKAASYWNGN